MAVRTETCKRCGASGPHKAERCAEVLDRSLSRERRRVEAYREFLEAAVPVYLFGRRMRPRSDSTTVARQGTARLTAGALRAFVEAMEEVPLPPLEVSREVDRER